MPTTTSRTTTRAANLIDIDGQHQLLVHKAPRGAPPSAVLAVAITAELGIPLYRRPLATADLRAQLVRPSPPCATCADV